MHATLRQRQLRLHRRRAGWAYGDHGALILIRACSLLLIRGRQLQRRVHRRHADAGPRPASRPTSARSGARLRPRGHPRRRDPDLRLRPRDRDAGPGRPSRAPTPTTPRPRPTPCSQALDAVLGAGNYTDPAHRGGRPQGGRRAPAAGGPRDPALVPRRAGLPRVSVRVALRPRRGHRDGARHPRHLAFIGVDAARGQPDRGGGAAHDGRLLAQRHDRHLRPGAGESARSTSRTSFEEHPQPLDQRDPAADILTHGTTLCAPCSR